MNATGPVGIALALTLLAGLSTGIGSAIAYFIRRPRIAYLSFALGFSAGVMIYVSFMELLPQAIAGAGQAQAVLFFFIGVAFIGLIDLLVPEPENPHNLEGLDEPQGPHGERRLMRTGLLMALAIAAHNFPEGLATFAAGLTDTHLGVFIAVAVAIHNIPEGIAVSVPIFYATGNRKKAFTYSFLSGLAEPAGAALGYLVPHAVSDPGDAGRDDRLRLGHHDLHLPRRAPADGPSLRPRASRHRRHRPGHARHGRQPAPAVKWRAEVSGPALCGARSRVPDS